MGDPYLSIIVPAYNESPRILPTLEQIDEFIKKQSYEVEVIVVDDCSTDNTYDSVFRFIVDKPQFKLIKNRFNMGKGKSVKKGMMVSSGQYRVFSDADLSTPLDEIHKFLAFLEPQGEKPGEYDLVIGSRRVKGAHIGKRQPLFREGSGRVFSILVRLFVLRGFLDTQCGFKMFKSEVAKKIFRYQSIPGFGFDVEILFIAQKKFGYKIKEAPVTWTDSPATQVRLLRDSTRMFLDLFKIRWNNLTGKYNRW